jgi:hypothetical protein
MRRVTVISNACLFVILKEEIVMGRLAKSPNNTNNNTVMYLTDKKMDAAWEEEIRSRIAERAYFKAQARGYEPGHEIQDWIEAEAEIQAEVYL